MPTMRPPWPTFTARPTGDGGHRPALAPGAGGDGHAHAARGTVDLPYIKRLVRSQEEGVAPKPLANGSLKELIVKLEAEHEATGDALADLARLSGGYTPPADACPTYRTLYALLAQFDATTKSTSTWRTTSSSPRRSVWKRRCSRLCRPEPAGEIHRDRAYNAAS
ncbi:MAG: hypothetical protein HZY76_11440 [Anaerolineae bacterium]|nr:MAG: hypothetical protein HZY76_11440 [Anaerolineae bacterium]